MNVNKHQLEWAPFVILGFIAVVFLIVTYQSSWTIIYMARLITSFAYGYILTSYQIKLVQGSRRSAREALSLFSLVGIMEWAIGAVDVSLLSLLLDMNDIYRFSAVLLLIAGVFMVVQAHLYIHQNRCHFVELWLR
jgi:predicted MFS family arabinose efflux permease